MSNMKTEVVIFTRRFRIEGIIDLIKGARITDFMNQANAFMAVTGAKVTDLDGNEVLKGEFINVQVTDIEIIIPKESLQQS